MPRFTRQIFAKGQRGRKIGMNRTEEAYAAYLEQRRLVGEIEWYKFEGVKLRLADNCFYTGDFFVMLPDGTLQVHEVKGIWEDAGRVKIKVAADMYPFQFIAIKVIPRKDGGGWAIEEF